jgi:hypothetical protein
MVKDVFLLREVAWRTEWIEIRYGRDRLRTAKLLALHGPGPAGRSDASAGRRLSEERRAASVPHARREKLIRRGLRRLNHLAPHPGLSRAPDLEIWLWLGGL